VTRGCRCFGPRPHVNLRLPRLEAHGRELAKYGEATDLSARNKGTGGSTDKAQNPEPVRTTWLQEVQSTTYVYLRVIRQTTNAWKGKVQ
jgi:hypothetical protein